MLAVITAGQSPCLCFQAHSRLTAPTQQSLSIFERRNNLSSVRRRRTVCDVSNTSSSSIQELAARITASPLYSTWLQGAVVVGILAAVDAGFSGDWSRIGAITKEDEIVIQHACTTLGGFHIACAALGATVACRRGASWPAAAAKIAAVGFLALMEVRFSPAWEADDAGR